MVRDIHRQAEDLAAGLAAATDQLAVVRLVIEEDRLSAVRQSVRRLVRTRGHGGGYVAVPTTDGRRVVWSTTLSSRRAFRTWQTLEDLIEGRPQWQIPRSVPLEELAADIEEALRRKDDSRYVSQSIEPLSR